MSRRASEKDRRKKFEDRHPEIPKDKSTILEGKAKIARALGLSPHKVTFHLLSGVISQMRRLRVDCYQFSRDPRTLAFYVYQVLKNLAILEQYSHVIRKNLGLSENNGDEPLSEHPEADAQDNKTSQFDSTGAQSHSLESSDVSPTTPETPEATENCFLDEILLDGFGEDFGLSWEQEEL